VAHPEGAVVKEIIHYTLAGLLGTYALLGIAHGALNYERWKRGQ
jgi:hypothetical protein